MRADGVRDASFSRVNETSGDEAFGFILTRSAKAKCTRREHHRLLRLVAC